VTPDHVMSIFVLLDAAMRKSGVRSKKGLKAIDFEIASSPRVVWSFDPAGRDRLFAPRRHPRPALTIACPASFLAKLLSPDELAPADSAGLLSFGDTGALEALVAALVNPRSMLELRAGGKS